jgi:branched-subunit amino acid transport protein AzlD
VPNPGYIAAALAVAVAITVTLRALPFGMKNAMKESALLADIGRWMPLGPIAILAAYCLTSINVTTPTHGIPELTGVAATSRSTGGAATPSSASSPAPRCAS